MGSAWALSLCVSVSVCASLSVCVCVSLSLCERVCLSVCLSVMGLFLISGLSLAFSVGLRIAARAASLSDWLQKSLGLDDLLDDERLLLEHLLLEPALASSSVCLSLCLSVMRLFLISGLSLAFCTCGALLRIAARTASLSDWLQKSARAGQQGCCTPSLVPVCLSVCHGLVSFFWALFGFFCGALDRCASSLTV